MLDRTVTVAERSKPRPDRNPSRNICGYLQLAGGWFYSARIAVGRDIDTVRDVLLSNRQEKQLVFAAKKQTDLAMAYIGAVGQAPLQEASERLNDLFENLTGVHEAAFVKSHYSLKQLDIVEALIQTIVSDSFTMDQASLRWLDDEEFLIRRRIHRDLRTMLN
ncbi:MAG: hypothetical protein R3C49_28155 [Planctomycetaceae bacterium]